MLMVAVLWKILKTTESYILYDQILCCDLYLKKDNKRGKKNKHWRQKHQVEVIPGCGKDDLEQEGTWQEGWEEVDMELFIMPNSIRHGKILITGVKEQSQEC